MNEFSIKPKFFFGQDAVKSLLKLPIKKAFIICDPFMIEGKMIHEVTDVLDQNGINYQVFSKVVPDPTIEVVAAGVAEISQFQPDTVITLGGGSAMDSAKAIRKVYSEVSNSLQPCLIAIPTTSGSGSEMTSVAVISDSKTNQKIPLMDDSLIPDISILDSVFTISVPSAITANAGVDVLTHCLEAYVATGANDFTDACAEKAMRIVWHHLLETYLNGKNSYARERMHNASSLAGIAFNGAGLGLCHGMAHAFGAFFHMAHGRINGMLLPHIIRFNAGLDDNVETETLQRYAKAADVLGLKGNNSREKVSALIEGIQGLLRDLHMPETIAAAGIERNTFLEKIPELVNRALDDDCTKTNPRLVTGAEVNAIYQKL
jgi:alcohol dehydrogenase class IV